ncbi:MAG: chromosome segregation protein SMC [Verrucomicrobiae bacterium]|nr:chromosome segregation protein SMC [Verrucomicrobiae bacterium]
MYLKALELIGFKSFAEKTRLEFPAGVTAIVGPNGCGKSNVLDAIRWVLGEQSAKALRGTEMADVIFSGTDQRKQVGMAEVSLTFTDCENELGTEYHEVTVSRRVFRDGRSEYELNKTLCRLRDIQHLFMDTGIGRSAYSIMEQGKIDKILSARPEDRREIFEEAAGITKYKTQKKETSRKLEHTEANLIRLEDILREVRRQINSLQRQAGKARRYQELFNQLKTLETQLGQHQLQELHHHIQKIKTQLTAITEELEQSNVETGKLELELQETRQQLELSENQIENERHQRMELNSSLDRGKNRQILNQERLSEIEQQNHQFTLDIAGAEERSKIQTEQLNQFSEQIEALQQRILQHQGILQEKQTQAQTASENLRLHFQTITQCEKEIQTLEQKLQPLNQQLSNRDAEQRTLTLRIETIENEKNEDQKNLETLREKNSALQTQHSHLTQQIHQSQETLLTHQKQQQETQEKLAQIQQQYRQLEQQLLEKITQRDLLKKWQASHQEYTPAIQQIFQAKHENQLPEISILETLAEVIHITDGYQTAVEALLQHQLETLIIPNTEAAWKIIEFLQNQNTARIHLAPLDSISQQSQIDSRSEAAIHFVSTSSTHQKLLTTLLNHAYITETLNEAFTLKQQLPQAIIATRSGELIDACGVIGSGPLPKQIARLNRQAEIDQFHQPIHDLESQIQTLKDQETRLIEKNQSFLSQIETLKNQLDQQKQQEQAWAKDLHLLTHQIQNIEQKLQNYSGEIYRLTESDQHATERYHDQIKERDLLEQKRVALQQQLATYREQLPAHQETESQFAQQLTEFRITTAALDEKLKGLFAQRDPIASRLQELKEIVLQRQQSIQYNQEKRHQLEQENETLEKEIQSLTLQQGNIEEKLKQLQTERGLLQQSLDQKQQSFQKQQKQQTQTQQNRAQAELQLAKYDLEKQNLKERLFRTYQLDLESLPTTENITEPQEWDLLQQQIEEMRSKLDNMGPVNLEAVSEYDELEKRLSFLESQQKDLLDAKQHLLDAITFINRTTKKLFVETFEQIRLNFQSTFTELFGGGKANLLLNDEQDPLECGIEIVAKPPGKQPQVISLLSGGERTMTAVALLFAIYKVKPSPFCVLDEMDAPLDESNIDRFLKILKRFLDQSQFLLITHNKKTISIADTLYGVTMEEKGISKIISVKLNRKSQETSILSTPATSSYPALEENISLSPQASAA